MDEDEVWTRRIEASLAEARRWEERTRVEPEDIDPRSSLGADDARVPAFTVSTMAWFGLQTSVDHLAQVADILRPPGGALPLRPHPPFTLIRTALLAAGQTVWLLSGRDRDERLRRTAIVYREEWDQHLKYLNDYALDPAIQPTLAPGIAGALGDRIAHLTVQLDEAKKSNVGRLYSTSVLDEAAKWVTRHQSNGWQRRALIYGWRMGSAAAHARQWPLNYREGKVTIDRTDRMSVRWLATTDQEIGTALGAANLMTREGFRLWDERRTLHLGRA